MNLSAIFIRRPVATTLLTLGIVVFGAISYGFLPVSDLPAIDFPTIQVSAGLPGASPATMASAVALPLEKALSTISGLTSISSLSSVGSTNIALQFDLTRNIDAAAQDVQAAIARTVRSLPPNMPAPPTLQKSNPTDQAVISLVLQSPTLPMSVVDEQAQIVSQRLSALNGVSQVSILGSQKFAVRVDVDPSALATRGIGIDEVASAINSANVNLPTGTLYGDQNNFVVQVDGQLLTAAAYEPVIVAYRGGSPVRLNEVAHVYAGIENDRFASWYRGQPTIYLQINKQPDANVVQVVEDIKKQLPALNAQLPAAISLTLRSDRSLSIRDSVRDVKVTLLITIALVVLVIFLFLRNLSTTLIPSLALPASIVATFSVMYLLSYSLDTLSLMALTLSVGFVVDDAIVMLENIVRHMEMGKAPMRAAYDASEEVAFTILSMTLSLVAVFIPVLFMGGIVGRLLHEFAVTISCAILVSGFVAISLTPMLCSRFLRPLRTDAHGALYNATERMFDAWLRLYDRTLQLSLRYRALTMAVSLVLMVATAYLYVQAPKGFLPSEDQGRFQLNLEGTQGLGFAEMARHQREVDAIVARDPNVLAFATSVGVGTGTNQGQLYIDLKPRNERALSVDEVMAELRPQVARVAGLRAFMVNPPLINIGARNARALYQFTLQDADTDELYRWAPVLEDKMKGLPGIEDVNSDLLLKNPQLNVRLDR
ncbi:MAG: efflux RND transporter permease subunit, partial [Acidobacteriota bacterium]